MQQVSNFVAVSSSKVEDGLEVVDVVGWCLEGEGCAIEDAMVIMTPDSSPTGDACRLSTGEIIFY